VAEQHAQFVALASKLIAKNGRSMLLVRNINSGSTFDPTITENTAAIVAMQLSYKSNEIDGDIVQREDKLFLVNAAVRPDTNMKIRDLGTGIALIPVAEQLAGFYISGDTGATETSIDYSIISVVEVKPGATTIMYKIQGRF
jgi:hypothetical protein